MRTGIEGIQDVLLLETPGQVQRDRHTEEV